ncbi:MAG: recombinase family protein [Pyrinomonadaceae bacterium]
MNNSANNQAISKATGGIAPFGYRWQHGLLVIDEKESPVRKLICELFIKHKRKKTVAKLLNDLGYRTRNGSLFSDTTIDRLIRDTTAKGIKIINGKEIKVEAIVSNEIWEKANNFLGQKITKQPIHLFVGFAYCACGGKMIMPGNVKKYVCLECRHKIDCEDLEEIFMLRLSGLDLSGILNQSDNQTNLSDYWQFFTFKEKRIVIEQITSKIIIGKTEISIEFACQIHSFKTPTFSQQSVKGNETPKIESTQPNQPILNEPMMNEIESAKFLGISRMTLLRKRNEGEIGFYRVGFRVLYSREKHLIPFLNNCEK